MKTIRRDMIDSLRRGLSEFGANTEKTLGFLAGLQNPDGGFRGRSESSDLYYSVFAAECLLTSGTPFNREALADTLASVDIHAQDFIHLCCLIRLAGNLSLLSGSYTQQLCQTLEVFRCEDGLFHHAGKEPRGSVYGTFMAMGAFGELGQSAQDTFGSLQEFLEQFKNPDGSFRNDTMTMMGTVPATAAAMVIQQQLNAPCDTAAMDWLVSCLTDEGGFAVNPMMPVADLLSTSTALHSLCLAGMDLGPVQNKIINFVRGCLCDNGGFCANAYDASTDSEYTFYGLLALGNCRGR